MKDEEAQPFRNAPPPESALHDRGQDEVPDVAPAGTENGARTRMDPGTVKWLQGMASRMEAAAEDQCRRAPRTDTPDAAMCLLGWIDEIEYVVWLETGGHEIEEEDRIQEMIRMEDKRTAAGEPPNPAVGALIRSRLGRPVPDDPKFQALLARFRDRNRAGLTPPDER